MMKFRFENKWSAKKTTGLILASLILAIALVVLLDAVARAGDLQYVQSTGESFIVNLTDVMRTSVEP